MDPHKILARSDFRPTDGTVYSVNGVSPYYGSIDPMSFHLAIWLSTNDFDNFTLVTLNNKNRSDSSRMVLFGDKDGYQEFSEWFETYKKRFPEGNYTATRIPWLPGTGRYHLTFVSNESDADGVNVVLDDCDENFGFKKWGWIVSHCEGLVFQTNSGYAFESEEDAFLYKLSFPG